MILILSTNKEYSTDRVVDWLYKLKGNFIRLNDNDIVNPISKSAFNITSSNGNQVIDIRNNVGRKINLDEITVVWFRKFGFFSNALWFKELRLEYGQDVLSGLKAEYFTLLSTCLQLVRGKKWLTPYWKVNLNKYAVMEEAKKVGINIPATYIVSNKRVLLNIYSNHDRIISKSIKESFHCKEKNGSGLFSMFTEEITRKDINDLPDDFFASYVQECIEKDYEIRIFYLNGECYPMAIYSQKDTQTQLDYKRYNNERPNRKIPCSLPKDLLIKIKSLMDNLDLNSGSLDFIKSTDGRLIFLEVNPVGQFGMVAYPCNYNLDRKVAETLIKMDK